MRCFRRQVGLTAALNEWETNDNSMYHVFGIVVPTALIDYPLT
jgi:hypothetical protein